MCAPLLGEYCVNNEKCAPDDSICIHNECRCRANYSSVSNNQCKLKILGEPCTADSKCEVVKFAKCSAYDNKCDCTANTAALNSTMCAPLLDGFCEKNNECVVKDSTCVDNKCKCKPNSAPQSNTHCKEVYMRMPCDRDSDCNEFINHSSCIEEKVCACIINHHPINRTVCAPMYNQSCQNHEPCAISNSLCINNKCRCKHNYVYQEFKCYPIYLEEPCVVHEDCHKIKFGICSKDKKCVCDDKHTQFNKTSCGPIIGGFCSKDDECKISNSKCINNRCECEAFYSPLYNEQCLPTLLGWNCVYDGDCRYLCNAICSESKKCVCQSNHVPLNNTACVPLLGEYCWNDEQCITNNSVCINHVCQCNNDFIKLSNDECIDGSFNEYCEGDKDCKVLINARCSEEYKKCRCKHNYVKIDKIACAPLLGEFCRHNERCGLNNAICINNQCSCQPYYIHDFNGRCIPLWLGFTCERDNDCERIQHAKCSKNNKCVCKSNYFEFNRTTCISLIGEYCMENTDCYPIHSICEHNICKCANGFVRQSNNECLSRYLGIFCKNNHDCGHVMHSICSVNHRCVCIANHVALSKTTCAPLLNESCSSHGVCATSNAICIDNRCRCKHNYLPQSNNNCIPELLKGDCSCDSDCNAIDHAECSTGKKCVCMENYISINRTTCILMKNGACPAIEQCDVTGVFCRKNCECGDLVRKYCSENQTCICKPNYIELNGSCQPIINGYCTEDKDCIPDNSFCYLNICRCKNNFLSVSNDRCKAISLGTSCESDVDCNFLINAKCSNGKTCVCNENSTPLNKFTCTVIIGGSCSNNNHCHIGNSSCVNNICQCKPSYLPASDLHCAETSSLDACSKRSECRDALHMDCSINETCVCKPHHTLSTDKSCGPPLGGFCWLENQCVTENSACIDNSCECKPGYIKVSFSLCMQAPDY
ncbi:protein eyes shut homolog [Microplitis mediator]|uniref:protein eyes shut homolog n=1 Tax=Microplitis mediator TaxID=375433 RepID=UPI0025576266|nr:protein eyes shut homolog [Microplitis mediator]